MYQTDQLWDDGTRHFWCVHFAFISTRYEVSKERKRRKEQMLTNVWSAIAILLKQNVDSKATLIHHIKYSITFQRFIMSFMLAVERGCEVVENEEKTIRFLFPGVRQDNKTRYWRLWNSFHVLARLFFCFSHEYSMAFVFFYISTGY